MFNRVLMFCSFGKCVTFTTLVPLKNSVFVHITSCAHIIQFRGSLWVFGKLVAGSDLDDQLDPTPLKPKLVVISPTIQLLP